MNKTNEAALIAEYENLRREADKLDQRGEQVDARLVELEHLLPDSYTYPGDPLLDSNPPLAGGDNDLAF